MNRSWTEKLVLTRFVAVWGSLMRVSSYAMHNLFVHSSRIQASQMPCLSRLKKHAVVHTDKVRAISALLLPLGVW
jgi:hypothetical protein